MTQEEEALKSLAKRNLSVRDVAFVFPESTIISRLEGVSTVSEEQSQYDN